jgi:sugar phosphate isomerase/epimerase
VDDQANVNCVSRRGLLQSLAAAAAGVMSMPQLVGALARGAERVEPRAARPPIGLQLYTVRALMARDVEGTIAALAAAGVRSVEFAGYFQRAPTALRLLLDRHEMTAPAAHVPMPFNVAGWGPLFDTAEALGHRWLVIPWVGHDVRSSLDGWRRLADALNEAGVCARQRNLRLAYHNHDFEFAVMDGSVAYDVFVDRLDASVVDLELDLYWASKAGQDPSRMVADRPGRFPLWHLKDATPAPERAVADVGAGTLDFAALLAAGAPAGLQHAFIESDNPLDPLASVHAGVAALSRRS